MWIVEWKIQTIYRSYFTKLNLWLWSLTTVKNLMILNKEDNVPGKYIHYFKINYTLHFCLFDLILSLHHRLGVFFLIKHCVLIPNITTPRQTVKTQRQNSSLKQFHMIFSFTQGNGNFKHGPIDEHARICSAVESHIEEIIQLEIIQTMFQLYIWLCLQTYHSFVITKEYSDTTNKFDENKIKKNVKACNLYGKKLKIRFMTYRKHWTKEGNLHRRENVFVLKWNIKSLGQKLHLNFWDCFLM